MKIVQELLTEFTLFPKLPPEMRQKIFKHAVPTGPNGFRLLKVSGDIIAPSEHTSTNKKKRKPREPKLKLNAKCSIAFVLEDNEHSASVKNLTLSRTSRESRAIFLQQNPHTLRTLTAHDGRSGLIRYAKRDIIYIANFDVVEYSVALLPYFDFGRFEAEQIPNLAIPVTRLLNSTVYGPPSQPVLTAKKKNYAQTTFRLLTRLQGSRFLGLVCSDHRQPLTLYTFRVYDNVFLEAAINSTEVVRDILKASKHWTVEDLPEVQILDGSGQRVKHEDE